MAHHKRKLYPTILTGGFFLILITLLSCSSVIAAEIPLGFSGSSNSMESYFSGGEGLGSSLTIAPLDESPLQITPLPVVSPDEMWITIAPYTSDFSGHKINLIFGYLQGDRTGATVTLFGKKSSDSDFSEIALLNIDESGLFIGEVQTEKTNNDLFRVTVKSESTEIVSNTVSFSDNFDEVRIQPVINPVTVPAKESEVIAVKTPASTESDVSSGPVQTRLTISAPTTTPAVGQLLTISGRLTDKDGNGISGATVTIDETGYPGAGMGEPFLSTQTASDGSFEYEIGVSFADTVGLVAKYQGDGNYNSAQSNTIMFTAH